MIGKQYLLVLALLLFIDNTAHCCINEYRTTLSGKVYYTDGGNVAPTAHYTIADTAHLREDLQEADSIYRTTGKLSDYSDYGAMLIYNGRYAEAKRIFQQIEMKHPGLYATAANLGTTYELLGNNDSAYYWIAKAIRINPSSHEGSEWIHLKILQAKIKARGNNAFYTSYNILSLNFGDKKKPENINKLDLIALRNQLYYQLSERMSFVRPPDPIVAQLLFDLGNINAMTANVESGFQVFELAKRYGCQTPLFNKRYGYFKRLQLSAVFRNNVEGWSKEHIDATLAILFAAFVATIAVIAYIVKRLKRMNNNK